MQNETLTVVFCTCDNYSDLWHDFFRLFKKYWPQFNGQIILNTETKAFKYEGLNISEPLNCPLNTSWSDRLSLSLKKAASEYVLIMLDDFYLKASVDNERFLETLEFMNSNSGIASVTYLHEPGMKKEVSGLEGFNYRKNFSVYKMTAHLTLYRKEYLMSVLKAGESAWEFEVNGTVRAWFKRGRFLCPNNSFEIFPYDFGSLVIRGGYLKPVKEYFEKNEGCVFNPERPILEKWEGNASEGGLRKKIKYLIKGLFSVFKGSAL